MNITHRHQLSRHFNHHFQHPIINQHQCNTIPSQRTFARKVPMKDIVNGSHSLPTSHKSSNSIIAEGDGDRNLRCWKMLLLHFKNDTGSTKYALEALYYSLQLHSLFTPRLAYRLMWNCSVKGKGSNVPP